MKWDTLKKLQDAINRTFPQTGEKLDPADFLHACPEPRLKAIWELELLLMTRLATGEQMNVKQIEEARARESIKFDTAIRIRELLEAARKQYGADDWDSEDIEAAVLELVTEEP